MFSLKQLVVVVCCVASSGCGYYFKSGGGAAGIAYCQGLADVNERSACVKEIFDVESRDVNRVRHRYRDVECDGEHVTVPASPDVCSSILNPAVQVAFIGMSEQAYHVDAFIASFGESSTLKVADIYYPLIDGITEAQTNLLLMEYIHCRALAHMPCDRDVRRQYVAFLRTAPKFLRDIIRDSKRAIARLVGTGAILKHEVDKQKARLKKLDTIMSKSLGMAQIFAGQTVNVTVVEPEETDNPSMALMEAIVGMVEDKYQHVNEVAVKVTRDSDHAEVVVDIAWNSAYLLKIHQNEPYGGGRPGEGYGPSTTDPEHAFSTQRHRFAALWMLYRDGILPALKSARNIQGASVIHSLEIIGQSCSLEFTKAHIMAASPVSRHLHSSLGEQRAAPIAAQFRSVALSQGFSPSSVLAKGEYNRDGEGPVFRMVYARLILKGPSKGKGREKNWKVNVDVNRTTNP